MGISSLQNKFREPPDGARRRRIEEETSSLSSPPKGRGFCLCKRERVRPLKRRTLLDVPERPSRSAVQRRSGAIRVVPQRMQNSTFVSFLREETKVLFLHTPGTECGLRRDGRFYAPLFLRVADCVPQIRLTNGAAGCLTISLGFLVEGTEKFQTKLQTAVRRRQDERSLIP